MPSSSSGLPTVIAIMLFAAQVGACERAGAPRGAERSEACSARCEAESCGLPDGCGGTCACPDHDLPDASDASIGPESCQDACIGADSTCNDLCGRACRQCPAGSTCLNGACACEPRCDGTRCDDGCSGTCPCAAGQVCNTTGACVPQAICTQTCQDENAACGEVCGTWCGGCDETQSCRAGRCVAAISCPDCPLQLRVLARTTSMEHITSLRVVVDFLPGEMRLPRLLDLRLTASRPLTPTAAELGDALIAAGKTLARDEGTGQPWIERRDGSLQFLVLQSGNVADIGGGRLLELTFKTHEPGPLELRLVRREQTLAPPESDAALQASDYDTALVITR